jgi:hypothetical protein
MANVVRGSVLAMMFALLLGAIVAYFTPADSANDKGYFGAGKPRVVEALTAER